MPVVASQSKIPWKIELCWMFCNSVGGSVNQCCHSGTCPTNVVDLEKLYLRNSYLTFSAKDFGRQPWIIICNFVFHRLCSCLTEGQCQQVWACSLLLPRVFKAKRWVAFLWGTSGFISSINENMQHYCFFPTVWGATVTCRLCFK